MSKLFPTPKSPPSPKPVATPVKPQTTPTPSLKKDFYNTAFLPKIGNVDGSWWDPAYYMFFFTIVLIIINTIYINIKTSGSNIGLSFLISFSLFISTYFFTRSSSCLWAGGCKVFSIFNLIFPFLLVIVLFLLSDLFIGFASLRNRANLNATSEKEETEEYKASHESEADPIVEDPIVEDEYVEDLIVDGFSNTIEPFSSYCPY